MAVVLGNFMANKELKENTELNVKNMRLSRIKDLINQSQKLVDVVNDIYDTYYAIKKIDTDFAQKLWHLLCERRWNISINSYFSFGVDYGGLVLLSKYGISFYSSSKVELLSSHFDLTKEDIYRGHISLNEYMSTFELTDIEIDKIINSLETFLTYFESFAKRFFDSVSQYKIID